ncbi:MAG: hypothetical protein QXQ41_02220, partial [Candidatus Bathyarchaeia archaeon]
QMRVDVHLACIVLSELAKSGGGLRRRDIEKRTPMGGYGTRANFESILKFLKEHGYLAKAPGKRTAPYWITNKGRRFLEALSE